jgi:hypothetical protein
MWRKQWRNHGGNVNGENVRNEGVSGFNGENGNGNGSISRRK